MHNPPKSHHIVLIGHSFVASENRLPFNEIGFKASLVFPKKWRSPGTKHQFNYPNTLVNACSSVDSEAVMCNFTLPIFGNGNNSLIYYRGLSRTLNKIRPDGIWLWEEPWSLAAWQIQTYAQINKIPWILFSAENHYKSLPLLFQKIMLRSFAQACGAIVPTPEVGENLRLMGYVGPIEIIPLWIRPREKIKFQATTRRLAFIGRLIPLKRVDLLIKAISHIPDASISILGDGPEMPRLRALAQELGVFERVDFIGQIPNDQIELELKKCFGLVLITDENAEQAEQFGKAVLDGVFTGLPVLVSNTGNLKNFAQEFNTVTSISVQNENELAHEVQKWFECPPTNEQLNASRNKALQHYSVQAAADRFKLAFSRLLPSMQVVK